MHIRPAISDDCDAIALIWNAVIRDSHATFNDIEKGNADLLQMLVAKAEMNHPFLVAIKDDDFLGFATYGQFRQSNGYRHTMEHTIILAPKAQGQQLGRKLLNAIEDHARNNNVHSMFAGISHRNPTGIAFHRALGYDEVARLPEVGRKFDKWYDLILMQKLL